MPAEVTSDYYDERSRLFRPGRTAVTPHRGNSIVAWGTRPRFRASLFPQPWRGCTTTFLATFVEGLQPSRISPPTQGGASLALGYDGYPLWG